MEASNPPERQTPDEVLGTLSTSVDQVAGRLAGAYCFHGTRVLDPEIFRKRGLLPLSKILEEIWTTLRRLVLNDISDRDWSAFRSSVENGDDGYRRKMSSAMDIGPNGMLVREIFFNPNAVSAVDYLLCPEIVVDIGWLYLNAFGVELARRYCDAAIPCIVKFRSTQRLSMVTSTALWYAFLKVRYGDLTHDTSGYTGEGRAVSPEDILDVELVT